MKPHWSEVVETVIRVVETSPEVSKIGSACIIRDLRGRVRLAFRPNDDARVDTSLLETALDTELGGWYCGPAIWTSTASTLEQRRLATNILDRFKNRWPSGWPTSWTDISGKQFPIRTGTSQRWCGEQRGLSKHSWTQGTRASPPWPLRPETPAIVSFYSFKGGVGRTTTLGIVARRLASEGNHVVVVDLDLEAPGLGRFFDIETPTGVLDLLTANAATGTWDADETRDACRSIDIGSGRLTVFPVGAMDWSYIERLSVLDFSLAERGASSVEASLRGLLGEIKRLMKPDYILLDARAGLHDLGGLSLHALSHVDVLVGRSGRATLDGFRLVLQAVSRRRDDQDLRLVVAQTFVPLPLQSGDAERITNAWTMSMHEAFSATVYERLYSSRGDDLPEVTDNTAMHHPWTIPQYDSIARSDRLSEIDSTVLDAEPYVALTNRIIERCMRSRIDLLSAAESEPDNGSEDAILERLPEEGPAGGDGSASD